MPGLLMWPTIQPKFWPKKPVMKLSGRKIGRHDRELLHHGVEAVGDGGEVDVHRAREQVAVGVDQVADSDQVVVDVAEVAFVLLAHSRKLGDAAHQGREHVPLRCDRLAHPDEESLHAEDLLQFLVACVEEGLVLELVDPVVEVGEDREEAVDETVDDPVEELAGVVDRPLALHVALPHLGECRRFVAMDGDEELLGVEAVHLDETVVVGDCAVDDEEDVVVVVVDLGALSNFSESSTASGWNLKTSRRIA